VDQFDWISEILRKNEIVKTIENLPKSLDTETKQNIIQIIIRSRDRLVQLIGKLSRGDITEEQGRKLYKEDTDLFASELSKIKI